MKKRLFFCMDNIQFSKSFGFFNFRFKRSHHTDASAGTVCHHIGWIREGRATFDVQGKIYEFTAGDVFYTPSGCRYHSYWSGERINYDAYAFHYFPDSTGADYGVQKFEMTDEAWALLTALSADKRVSVATVGNFYRFLGAVLPQMTPTAHDPRRETVAAAREYIRTHTDFSARELSRHLGISESGLYALFRETLGRTPVEEKNRLRIERAVELLTTTDRSVESIAERLGFSSAAYFRKVLRAETGKTPRDIRKNSTKEL